MDIDADGVGISHNKHNQKRLRPWRFFILGMGLVVVLALSPSHYSFSDMAIRTRKVTTTTTPPSTSKTNQDNHYVDKLTENWQFCQVSYVGNVSNYNFKLPIWYQCEGPEYDRLARRIRHYANYQRNNGLKPPSWGHRPHALPANSTVLMFGNSHIRQIGHAIACQNGPDVVTNVLHYEPDLINPDMAVKVTFTNNSTLWIVANSYVAHSPYWESLLVRQTQTTSLQDDFDAVILGVFNSGHGRLTRFAAEMDEMQKLLPSSDAVDWENRTGPSVTEMAAVFEGPLAFATMFNGNGVGDAFLWRKNRPIMNKLKRETNRTNLYLQDSRVHLKAIGLEGTSNNRAKTSEAVNDQSSGHRCTGTRGGHPDLVAWDLTEFLYEQKIGRVPDNPSSATYVG